VGRIGPDGLISDFVGNPFSSGNAEGSGYAARLATPQGLAVDQASGVLYVADSGNYTIWKVTPSGEMTVGLDASAGASPVGLALTGDGSTLYISDQNRSVILRVSTANWTNELVAGEPNNTGSADGPGVSARFSGPRGISLNFSESQLWVADEQNHKIRKVDLSAIPSPDVTTVAGSGSPGWQEGNGTSAILSFPQSVIVLPSDFALISQPSINLVASSSSAGAVASYAGAYNDSNYFDGPIASSRFASPKDFALKSNHEVFVVDDWSKLIRSIDTNSQTVTLAAPAARPLSEPAVAYDPSNQVLYATDQTRNRIIRFNSAGAESAFAGQPDLSGGANGPGNEALFNEPNAITVGPNGVVYVGECAGATIRRILSSGQVSTLAGASGAVGYVDAVGSAARFGCLKGIAVDAQGVVYVADSDSFVIRKILPDGTVSTLAGTGGASGAADGLPGTGRFMSPTGLALDPFGNLYVSDTDSHTIRKVRLSDGEITTLAGVAGVPGVIDGVGSAARLKNPSGLTWASEGALYLVERGSHLVKKVTTDGHVTRVSGQPNFPGLQNGPHSIARFEDPISLTVTPGGIFFVGQGDGSIRQFVP
jgi:sugar lactone lactonase YvrE